jgi:hypothetical protein
MTFSAQDLIDVFTKLHNGQEPTIVKYSEEDYQRDLKAGFYPAMGAASKKGLAVGVTWPGETISDFPGWQKKTLESYVQHLIDVGPTSFPEMKAKMSDLSNA